MSDCRPQNRKHGRPGFVRTLAAPMVVLLGWVVAGCEGDGCSAGQGCAETTTTSSSVASSSSTSSTVTTSTSTSTTTNTLPPFIQCNVIFDLPGTVDLARLEFEVDYGRSTGGFVGHGRGVACVSRSTDLAEFNDRQGQKPPFLRATLTANPPDLLRGPTDLASCTYLGLQDAEAEDFVLSTVEAEDADGRQVLPRPEVAVRVIQCEDISCRCGDGRVGCEEECDDGNFVGGDGCDPECRLEAAAADGRARRGR